MNKDILTTEDLRVVNYYKALDAKGKKLYLKHFDLIILEFTDDGKMVIDFSDEFEKKIETIRKENNLADLEEAVNFMLSEAIKFDKGTKNAKRGKKKGR